MKKKKETKEKKNIFKVIVVRKDWNNQSETQLKVCNNKIVIKVKLINNAMDENLKKNTFKPASYNVIFLHINNGEAKTFFEKLSLSNKKKTILFSGGKSRYKDWCENKEKFIPNICKLQDILDLSWKNIFE